MKVNEYYSVVDEILLEDFTFCEMKAALSAVLACADRDVSLKEEEDTELCEYVEKTLKNLENG